MNAAIDLSNLHDMTDGDKQLEKMLFEEFFRASEELIEKLESLTGGSCLEWRTTMHSFTGIALNLGANHLGALCAKGQDSFESAEADKSVLLQEIKTAYGAVKKFIAAE